MYLTTKEQINKKTSMLVNIEGEDNNLVLNFKNRNKWLFSGKISVLDLKTELVDYYENWNSETFNPTLSIRTVLHLPN